MRCLSILFLLFCSTYGALAQVDIYGKVKNSDGLPLSGATINYHPKEGTVADLNGNFHIETNVENSIKLTVRFIGYKSIDTLINFNNASELHIEIEMTQELQELPNIEITASYQNIFDNYRNHIIDFTISKDIIYLIVKKGQKSFLCQANLRGTILEEHELKGGYTKFYNSCLGGVILVGLDWCAELHHKDHKLFITNEFSIDYFDKYIIPCKLKKDDSVIFKNISKHNKRIDYLKYELNQNPEIVYTVHDEVGETVSQSYFDQLLKEYYKESGEASIEHIDHGFDRQNIIDDGSWNGDLQDLIITHITHRLVLQYQALGLKEVKSDLFVMDGKAYILDEFNEQIVQLEKNLIFDFLPSNYDLDGKIEIIIDNNSKTYFLAENTIYAVAIESDQLKINKTKELEHCYFNERKLLHNGILYRLGRKSIKNVRKNIFRDNVE